MPKKDLSSLKRTLERATHKLESLGGQAEYPDPIVFCRETLGLKPTEYQTKVLLDENKFVSLRWSRQSGKTAIVSAKLLWYAVRQPATCIAIVSPSLRQSKQVLKRIAVYAQLLPKSLLGAIQKTRLEFTNGSTIEAYPNNPETIRGPSLQVVYCDEMGFIRDDVELYDAILFTLSTMKNGRFIASSTPGSKDNLFYKFCTDPTYQFSHHHVTWRDALEPNGPLKIEILDTIRKQLESDQWRWRREMEAEFAESEDSFFPLSLITNAVDESLAYNGFAESMTGKRLYMGVDFGKHHDHSALAVVEYDPKTKLSTLIHLHKFPLETEYGSVIGYVKNLVGRWREIRKIMTDQTGVGEVVTEDMKNEGLGKTDGISLNLKSKTDVMENLSSMLTKKELKLPYDPELIAEMNSEKFEVNKSGQLQFSHPSGTHDDQLWALGLACYGLRQDTSLPEYHPVMIFGHGALKLPFTTREEWIRQVIENQGKPAPPPMVMCLGCGGKRAKYTDPCPRCGDRSGTQSPVQ